MRRYAWGSLRVPDVVLCVTAALAICMAGTATRSQSPPTPAAPVQAQAQAAGAAATAAPPSTATETKPIPLTQVANRFEELGRILQEISRRLESDPDLMRVQAAITVHGREIGDRMSDSIALLEGTPTLFNLRDLENYWKEMNWRSSSERKLLAQKAAQVQRDMDLLTQQEALWTATIEGVQGQTALTPIADKIREALRNIASVKAGAQERLGQVVELQDQIARQDLLTGEFLDTVAADIAKYHQNLRTAEIKPLWAPRSERLQEVGPARKAHPAPIQDLHNLTQFAKTHRLAFLLIFALGLATLLGALGRRRAMGLDAGTPVLSNPAWLLGRPYSLAVLVGATGFVLMTPKAPAILISLSGAILLLPLFRLFMPLSASVYKPLFEVFTTAFVSYEVLGLLPISPVLERELDALWTVALIAAGVWAVRPSRARAIREDYKDGRWILLVIRTVLLLMGCALFANVLGYFDLATVLSQGTLYSLYLALDLYMVVHMASAAVEVIFKSPSAQRVATFRGRAEEFAKWSRRGIAWVGVLAWIAASLTMFTLGGQVQRQVAGVLRAPIVVGQAHFSLWGVVLFLLTLGAGFMLAQAVSFLLREEILPRMGLRRGMPEAFSTVTRYLLYLAVCLFAFYASGAPMDKFTLLTGALGVGIGFGLQNVVNNFVSGLILLFERPINPGDSVELTGGVMGIVLRIGIRSCTIKTYQGAEVIVPNSSLVSNNVINWTLSDRRRRIELPVGVAYGTDPAAVLALLEDAAHSVKGILENPAPVALFTGFGDSALNFELRFWAPDQDVYPVLRSAAAVAINEALRKAGMEIPFPQREVRLRTADEAAPSPGASPQIPK